MQPLANVVKLTQILLDACCADSSLVNGQTVELREPKLTKLLDDVGEKSALLTRPSALRYSSLFRNASTMNEGGYASFADYASKIGCQSLERSQNKRPRYQLLPYIHQSR